MIIKMEQPTQPQNRQTAFIVTIKDLQRGDYVKEDGWKPNFVLTASGKKVSRANIIGVVISAETKQNPQSFVIDDGTGTIEARSFEYDPKLENIEIGQLINVIGRIRQFETGIYLFPEIAKKIENEKWINYRKKLLGINGGLEKPILKTKDEPIVENEVEEEAFDNEGNEFDHLINMIRKEDSGNGVDIEFLKEKTSNEDIDNLIHILMERGDVFEVRPGKIKVLE